VLVTLNTIEETVYTVPAGVSTIVLGTQAANTTGSPGQMVSVTAKIRKPTMTAPLYQDFVLIDAFPVPPHEAADLVNGKLILEAGSSLRVSASASSSVDLTVSILETSNV